MEELKAKLIRDLSYQLRHGTHPGMSDDAYGAHLDKINYIGELLVYFGVDPNNIAEDDYHNERKGDE